MKTILVVEDEKTIRDELKELLETSGYNVILLEKFDNTLNDILNTEFDLLLLDINLPKVNGEFILKEIRKTTNVPIIMLTSRANVTDEVLSMSYGSDDYITKPYNPSILLLHIDAVLRRGKQETQTITYQDITLNIGKCQLERKDKIIPLSKNEMQILHYLMKHQGRIVSREEMMKYLWDSEEFIDDNTLTVNMSRIRKKLKELGLEHAIETKKGLGYLFL